MDEKDRLKKLEKDMFVIISNSYFENDLAHSKATKKWLLELDSKASVELQVAALAHDIERGTREVVKNEGKVFSDNKYKEEHSKRSVGVIVKLLEKYEFDKSFIDKVNHLVLFHEVGGDVDTDLLMNADSLAFFDTNIELYFKKYGFDETKFKIKYMYDRMSKDAKKIIESFKYDDLELNKIFKLIVNN